MRSWIGASSGLAAVVMRQTVSRVSPSGACQADQMPAMAKPGSSFSRMA